MKRVLILVEGQTEEIFVKNVLAPALDPIQLFPTPIILTTKRVKDGPNFKGGVTSFGKFERDMLSLLQGAGDALVTTLVDYYGLPPDFPGMGSRPNASPIDRVQHIEQAISDHFGNRKGLLPFFALHEFEAWLFSQTEVLPKIMTCPETEPDFTKIRTQFASPEDINENRNTAPSKRIVDLFPAYRKTLHGPMAIQEIGMDTIRSECIHFDWWMSQLEAFASS